MKRHLALWTVAGILTLTSATLSYGVGPLFENERSPGNRVEGPNPDLRLPGQNLPPPAANPERVQGEILKIESEVFVVRDVAGNEVRLQIDKDTKMDAVPQIGDKIEAQVTPQGHARIVKPAKLAAP
jgi:hypothetical protein